MLEHLKYLTSRLSTFYVKNLCSVRFPLLAIHGYETGYGTRLTSWVFLVVGAVIKMEFQGRHE